LWHSTKDKRLQVFDSQPELLISKIQLSKFIWLGKEAALLPVPVQFCRSGAFRQRPSDPMPIRDPPLGAVSRQTNPALLPCCRVRAFAGHHHGAALSFTLLNFIVSAAFHTVGFL